jgi:hypothetical protein
MASYGNYKCPPARDRSRIKYRVGDRVMFAHTDACYPLLGKVGSVSFVEDHPSLAQRVEILFDDGTLHRTRAWRCVTQDGPW